MKENTLDLVKQIVRELEESNISVMLGGGWAEELYGLIAPRPHKDIDLYYLASNFNSVDKYIISQKINEIKEKHMPHKRAFLVNSVMVEIVLIQTNSSGYFSDFWSKTIVHWPKSIGYPTFIQGLLCISIESLNFYRSNHDKLFTH